ncbi:hypothetical protein D3C80_1985170 [compost metagenome]
MSEQIELPRASAHSPAKPRITLLLRPPSACRPLLMVASSAVTLRPPTMPMTTDRVTIGQNGLSRANSSLSAPRVLEVMLNSWIRGKSTSL